MQAAGMHNHCMGLHVGQHFMFCRCLSHAGLLPQSLAGPRFCMRSLPASLPSERAHLAAEPPQLQTSPQPRLPAWPDWRRRRPTPLHGYCSPQGPSAAAAPGPGTPQLRAPGPHLRPPGCAGAQHSEGRSNMLLAWCTLLQPASYPALFEWLRTIDTYCTVGGAVMHKGLRTALPRAPQPVAAPLAPASAAGALRLCSPSAGAAGALNPSCTGFAGALRCGGALGAAGELRGAGCAGAGMGAGASVAGAAEGIGIWIGPGGAGLPDRCRTTRVSPLASGSAAATATLLSSGRRSTCWWSNVAIICVVYRASQGARPLFRSMTPNPTAHLGAF